MEEIYAQSVNVELKITPYINSCKKSTFLNSGLKFLASDPREPVNTTKRKRACQRDIARLKNVIDVSPGGGKEKSMSIEKLLNFPVVVRVRRKKF